MMIFTADSDLRFLAKCDIWFGDGTFKITPDGYVQQYTIHAYHDGITYPCVYALLPGKKQVDYEKMLDLIISYIPDDIEAAPTSIMTDFEPAAINAFKAKFKEAEVAGCFFHLGQSVWRKIQPKLGSKYKDEPEFAMRVRRFTSLAFVPPEQVHHYMRLVMADEAARNDGLLTELILYFQQWYVGQEVNGQEIQGRFPKELWNMYQRVKDGLPRTNNSLEGWHHAFANGIAPHPALPKLVQKYRHEQNTKAVKRWQHQAGDLSARQRIRYQKVTETLLRLIRKFDQGLISDLEYLDHLATKMKIPTR